MAARKKKATKKKTAKKTAKKKTVRQQNKTAATKGSVAAFLASIGDAVQKKDTKTVVSLMKKVTGEKPTMWGPSIVGFGRYHYKYASGREGDFFLTGVSPRKGNLTLYIVPGFGKYGALLGRLGKHKIAKSCLYIKKLADVDMATLEVLIAESVAEMRRTYPS